MKLKRLDLDELNKIFFSKPILLGRVWRGRFYRHPNSDKGLIMWLGGNVYETDLHELPDENDLLCAILTSDEV